LFFATPEAHKLLVRTRNCAAPVWGVTGDACDGRSDRIYEVYCPECFGDELNHVYLNGAANLTSIGTFTFTDPTIYNGGGAQFWFEFGLNGNTGFVGQASGISELNANSTNADVFVRPVVSSGAVIAVTGAVRAPTEPCTPTVNCVLGAWSSYSDCSVDCGGGYQHRTRTPVVSAQNGGLCDSLGDEKQCNTQQCSTELTGKARAGIVIACVCSAVLAGLIFFSFAKNKKVFTTKSKAQRKAAAAAAAAAQKQEQQQAQDHHKRASHEEATGEEDETVAVAQPVKTVHIWV